MKKKVRPKKYKLELTQMDMDDLDSIVSIGIQYAKKDHADSPQFLKAVEKLHKKIKKVLGIK